MVYQCNLPAICLTRCVLHAPEGQCCTSDASSVGVCDSGWFSVLHHWTALSVLYALASQPRKTPANPQ